MVLSETILLFCVQWAKDTKKKQKCILNTTEIRIKLDTGLYDLTIVKEIASCSSPAKDICVVLDDSMSMIPHIAAVYKSSFFDLRIMIDD